MPPISTFQSLQTTMIPTLEGMDLAGRLLEWQMKNDNLFPQLSDQLRVGQDGNLSQYFCKEIAIASQYFSLFSVYGVSGLSDTDYPSLEVGSNGLPLLRQMGIVNRVQLPPELVEHFGRKYQYSFKFLRASK